MQLVFFFSSFVLFLFFQILRFFFVTGTTDAFVVVQMMVNHLEAIVVPSAIHTIKGIFMTKPPPPSLEPQVLSGSGQGGDASQASSVETSTTGVLRPTQVSYTVL